MGVFHFKRFDVQNERSAMKVNTDGVLLGAVTDVFPEDRNILDVGTGTGVIALMLAQKLSEVTESFDVLGIDVDGLSAEEAAANFAASPWKDHLKSENIGLKDYSPWRPEGSGVEDGFFDLIVSNPPYFDNSLEAPEARRNAARHTGDTLSYREILEYAAVNLAENGRVAMILPADQEKVLLRYARMCRFEAWKILRIKSVERKPASRIIVQFRKKCPARLDISSFDGAQGPLVEELVLLEDKGKRTSQHASLVTDYLL